MYNTHSYLKINQHDSLLDIVYFFECIKVHINDIEKTKKTNDIEIQNLHSDKNNFQSLSYVYMSACGHMNQDSYCCHQKFLISSVFTSDQKTMIET